MSLKALHPLYLRKYKRVLFWGLLVVTLCCTSFLVLSVLCNHKLTFGILFANTSNLGDDVQTIAQMQFIPQNTDTVVVNREHLNHEERKCIVIMNGWFMHNDKNFPPHPHVTPIYISFHIEKKGMLSKDALAHYKKFEPIGCRDSHTMNLLLSKGIKAYFSGCLTLTLKNPFANFKREKIYIVDAHLTSKVVYPWGADHLLEKLIPKYIRDQAEYIEHEIPDHIDKDDMIARHSYVHQHLLSKYAKARLVITTRLHCALPCVAYNTPVIVLQQNLHTDNRFTGLSKYFFGYSSVNDVVDFDFDHPKPKLSPQELHSLQTQIRRDIQNRITSFA
jgi:hypothetical protein